MVGSRIVEPLDPEAALPPLRALADPTRLRIVALLGPGPRCVCSLREEVGVAANLLSHHLRVLREAGVIEGTRRGRWIDYRLQPEAFDAVERLLDALRGGTAATGHAAGAPTDPPIAARAAAG